MAHYDVIVIGAGPAGAAAAIAAARAECRVLLVDKNGGAGGMATAGMVNPILGHYYRNPDTGRDGSIIAGLLSDIFDALDAHKARLRFRYDPGETGVFSDAFDDAWLRVIYDELLGKAGVEVLYHSQLLDAQCSAGRVQSVRILCKTNVRELTGDTFIDSTGDGDLAALCGVPTAIGRAEDGLCQPCSTMFRIGGVDTERLLAGGLRAAREIVNERFVAARTAGRIVFPFRDSIAFYPFPRPGVLHFNATRMTGPAALTPERLSQLEIEGRRQAAILCDWLVAEAPCFESAYLDAIAPQTGVRETRRITGRYALTRQDVLAGARFADGIARSGYFIDIHDPNGPGGLHADRELGGRIRHGFKPSRYYEIPLRCLQPADVENLLVACRALSADHYAHAAVRVMGTMTAVGQAAGLAAGIAKDTGCPPTEIDGAAVRERLGYLDSPLAF